PKQQRHPKEKLTDSSFTQKYWDILMEPDRPLDGSSSSDGDDEDGTSTKPTMMILKAKDMTCMQQALIIQRTSILMRGTLATNTMTTGL
ncbi:uncharacterized protein VP01_5368g1, partial [Puccinia sorghi]